VGDSTALLDNAVVAPDVCVHKYVIAVPAGSEDPDPSSVKDKLPIVFLSGPAFAVGCGAVTAILTKLALLFSIPSFTTKLKINVSAINMFGDVNVGDTTVLLDIETDVPDVCDHKYVIGKLSGSDEAEPSRVTNELGAIFA
jgi:hypothetical protein